MYIHKVIYSVIGILLALFFVFTASTVYGYCCAGGALFAAIYIWLIKEIIKGDVIEIKVYDDRNEYERVLEIEEVDKVKQLICSNKASFNLNKNYIFSNRYLLIISEKAVCRIYYGIDAEGNKVLKMNSKWYEIEVDESNVDEIVRILS